MSAPAVAKETVQQIGQNIVEKATQEEIARLAYALWRQRGCPDGSANLDWLEAERQYNKSIDA